MVYRSSSKRSSLYDSLPVLDSWYQPEEEEEEEQIKSSTTTITPPIITPSPSPRPSCFSKTPSSSLERPSCADGRRSVSFSVEPPSVRYIDEREQHHQEDAVSEQLSLLTATTSISRQERRDSRGECRFWEKRAWINTKRKRKRRVPSPHSDQSKNSLINQLAFDLNRRTIEILGKTLVA
ncbi:hypothetical protein BDB00DRAFT_409398 [Zychaea mexicana]|uniref:uncharacterized protein n=1 Tax=Zychaea mexicana TaxID=64656 RepID=UPI0022FE96F8|nr:uncharacterized protein BDB00DRAFT_409398 [Zychaea mexicana]KAI9492964.1 hypothetical protein BDB00DRAFT_409398 [Zychaea mexicana]